MKLEIIPIKTHKFLPPKSDLYAAMAKYLPKLKEGDILFITSKILAIHQGRCVKISPRVNKDKLIIKESEKYIPKKLTLGQHIILAIKEKTIAAYAGIDESNGNGYYILFPKKPAKMAEEICRYLKKIHKIKKLAVVVTDSHTSPLRRGTTGISTGFFGLAPIKNLIGKKDIFGRRLAITQVNIVDALAAAAVLLMGESSEQTPLLILRGADFIKFTDKPTYKQISFPEKQDLYAPLFKVFKTPQAS